MPQIAGICAGQMLRDTSHNQREPVRRICMSSAFETLAKSVRPRNRAVTRAVSLLLAVLFAGGAVAWYTNLLRRSARPPQNAILVIAPYRYNGTWVFDDERAGLVREPFVAGVPEMIDFLVKDIPNAADGFRLTFAAQPFPGFQKKLTWLRGDMGGNYYQLDDPPMEGWLCPALMKYYEEAPAELYVKADPR